MYSYADPAAPPVNEETVGHLRQRLNVMRDIVKVRSLQESILKETRKSFFPFLLVMVAAFFRKEATISASLGPLFQKNICKTTTNFPRACRMRTRMARRR